MTHDPRMLVHTRHALPEKHLLPVAQPADRKVPEA